MTLNNFGSGAWITGLTLLRRSYTLSHLLEITLPAITNYFLTWFGCMDYRSTSFRVPITELSFMHYLNLLATHFPHIWFGCMDSNHDKQDQNLLSCR